MAIPDGGVFLGRAGTGSAYVLGSNLPSALAIYEQGQRARALAAQREALAKQKAQDEDLKRFTTVLASTKDDTGLTYNTLHQNAREALGKKFMEVATDPNLGSVAKATMLDGLKTGYEQDGRLGTQNDLAIKSASDRAFADKEIDYVAAVNKLHGLQYDPANNVLPANQFPLRKMDDVLEDPSVFNTAKIYDNFVSSKVAPKETYQQAVGGKPGTYSRSFTDEIRYLKKNPDGSPYHDPITHKTQTEITPQLLEKAMEVPRIRLDLNGLMEQHKALSASADAKMARNEQLTPEERAASEVNPTLTDLLGRRMSTYGYANHHETQRYNRYPVPKTPKAAGATDTYTPQAVDPMAESRYSQPNTVDQMPDGIHLPGLPKEAGNLTYTTPVTRADYAVYGAPVPAPMDVTKAGKKTNKRIHFTPDEYDTQGVGGKTEHRTGNTQPVDGDLGELNRAFVDTNTGKHLYPKTTAQGVELVGSGRGKLNVQFDVDTEANKAFSRELGPTTEALSKIKNQDGTFKYPSPELAEAAARKALSQGTVRTTHLLTYKNQPLVEAAGGSRYRELQSELARETARMRAEYARKSAAPKPNQQLLGFPDGKPAKSDKPQNNLLGF